MQLTQRKRPPTQNEPGVSHNEDPQPSDNGKQASSSQQNRSSSYLWVGLILLVILFLSYLTTSKILRERITASSPSSIVLSSSSVRSDDEERIAAGRLVPDEDHVSSQFREEVLTCMPTVSRAGVEYISNAVKSWRLATNGSVVMRRLLVFEMDENKDDEKRSTSTHISTSRSTSTSPDWISRVFDDTEKKKKTNSHPSWLELHRREGKVRPARKQTLGDSPSRVTWRSKEAQDYAEVLRRCRASGTRDVRYILIVQDDVLFTSDIQRLVGWADHVLQEREYTESRSGRRRVRRICSGSLFDIVDEQRGLQQQQDVHEQQKSNMVARLWQVSFLERVVRYIERNYDEKPVDWLVDDMCRIGRRANLVMQPNPVRHRGAVSSFAENSREGLLT